MSCSYGRMGKERPPPFAQGPLVERVRTKEPRTGLHWVHVFAPAFRAMEDVEASYREACREIPWMSVETVEEFRRDEHGPLARDPSIAFFF